MPTDVEVEPISDSVAKTGGAVAVGEDLEFQQKWWKFERLIWALFGLILVADVSGLLGRGPLSKAELKTDDGALLVKYERVERENTPSIMTIYPQATALRDGSLHLFVSDNVVRELGAQRVVPQPATSTLGEAGVTYTFTATTLPMVVQIALQPSFIGSHVFRIGTSRANSVKRRVLVLP